ncbi:chemotaxis protein CheD [Chitinilyticum litopenaei]|uniref:chemotaxis protein CheD n=1 Tax=Chitinilyticum litopenaei TaxID=1121276 RepID=UPI00041C0E21|nr:chemotaxis protein CheD [Chitinilyticum litopenaei]
MNSPQFAGLRHLPACQGSTSGPAIHHGQPSAHHLEQEARNIPPGGVAVERQRPIATLLGSCIAVCLHDPQAGVLGMNHFLLPELHPRRISNTDLHLSGMTSMEVLVNAMLKAGAQKRRLTAKAFGGASIVQHLAHAVGERNIRFTEEWLAAEGIPLLACDWGDVMARKIVANPRTGDVFCRRLPCTPPQQRELNAAEAAYRKALELQLAQRRIDYFD